MATNPLTEGTMPLHALLTLSTAEQARWRCVLMVSLCTPREGMPPSWPWQTHQALLRLKAASGQPEGALHG